MAFSGFFRPRSNFYRLPNDWFDVWADVRRWSGRARILAVLKITEYVIKWSWGRQNYDRPVRISRREFEHGRRWRGKRLDRGTGLSSRSLVNALRLAEKMMVLEVHRENGGPSYLPRLCPDYLDEGLPFLGRTEDRDDVWQGFPLPEANFFLVPEIWTDLTRTATSETLILAVEYFFRHTWGWEGGWHEPCWMTEEEVARGRRYRSPDRREERYDKGIGYSVDRVRDALKEGVERGWLVWRRDRRRVEYALHLRGMIVSEKGEFLGFEREGTTRPPFADESTPLTDESKPLTDESTPPVTDESTPLTDESKPLADESTPLTDESKPYIYTDTSSDTSTDTTTRHRRAGGGGDGGGADPRLLQLLQRLTSLDPPISPEDAERLVATYGLDAVRAWLGALERDPSVRSVAAVLIHKLRTGQTPPGDGKDRPPDPGCSLCHGTGVIRLDVPETDPDYGRSLPCPRCGSGKTGGGHTAGVRDTSCAQTPGLPPGKGER